MAENDENTGRKGEASDSEAKRLERVALIERLVASGVSRLTAERMVVIQGGDDEPGRARRRPQARR